MNEVKAKRGFACISPERRKEIAAMGGRKAHELGKAHKFSKEEAVAAGRKGGQNSHRGKAGTAENAIFGKTNNPEEKV